MVPVAHLPKTTSGKIQRYALAARYASGEFAGIIAEMDRHESAAGGAMPGARSEIETKLILDQSEEIGKDYMKELRSRAVITYK